MADVSVSGANDGDGPSSGLTKQLVRPRTDHQRLIFEMSAVDAFFPGMTAPPHVSEGTLRQNPAADVLVEGYHQDGKWGLALRMREPPDGARKVPMDPPPPPPKYFAAFSGPNSTEHLVRTQRRSFFIRTIFRRIRVKEMPFHKQAPAFNHVLILGVWSPKGYHERSGRVRFEPSGSERIAELV